MTFTIGSWIIPAVVTALAIGLPLLPDPAPRGYGDIGNGILALFQVLIGIVVSLIAWLIWALAA